MKHLSEQEIINKVGIATNIIIEYCKWYSSQSGHLFEELFTANEYVPNIMEKKYQTSRNTYVNSSQTKEDLIRYALDLKSILDENNVTYMMDSNEYPKYSDVSFFNTN